MKYLKRYNESVDSDDAVIDTIKDMSLDLQDIGLGVSVSKFSIHGDIGGTNGRVVIRINGGDNIHREFGKNDVYDFLVRLNNYLSNNGFKKYIISYNYRDFTEHEYEDHDYLEDQRADSMDELLSALSDKGIILSEVRLYYKRDERDMFRSEMEHLRRYNESDNSSIWNEIEDILTPIKDDGILYPSIKNFRYPTERSLSSILIKKNWDFDTIPSPKDRDKRYFPVNDIKNELNHLCNRFPDIINQIQIFRSAAGNPTKYTPEEFIKESPVGSTFLVGITLKIKKDDAPYIPR